jgi:hypothetical protein
MRLYKTTFCLAKFLITVTVTILASCSTTYKLVYQTQTDNNKVRFFVTSDPKPRKGGSKFYARVDSSSVRIYYSFLPYNIYKTYNNNGNYVYTLVSDKQPMLHMTRIDSVVFAKASNLMDSLGYKDLKRTNDATGFVIEIAGH